MKKQLFYFLVCGLALMAAGACERDESVELSVDQGTMSVGKDGGERTFAIQASDKWTAAKTTSWITVEPASGVGYQNVKVTVRENIYYDIRQAKIYITSVDKTAEVTILQSARILYPPAACGPISGSDANRCTGVDSVSVRLSISAIPETDKYEWKRNGEIIPGATSLIYTATESGSYSVAAINAAGTGTASPVKEVTISKCPPVRRDILGYGKTYKYLTVDKSVLNAGSGTTLHDPFLSVYTAAEAGLSAMSRTMLSFRIGFLENNRMQLYLLYLSGTTTYSVTIYYKTNIDPDGNVYFTDIETTTSNYAAALAESLLSYLLYSGTHTVGSGASAKTVQPSGNKFLISGIPNLTAGLTGELAGLYVITDPEYENYIPGVLGN
ncbi:MAG: hypothetical protein LBS12_03080 [Prevotellaceae bacterium]|jgi:hypothetical protein|nr:hypothetical protein [Prevotellaceae bacterium]